MKQQSKFSENQEHLAAAQTQAQVPKEFASSDELLRFDAAQTTVPPEIGATVGVEVRDGWIIPQPAATTNGS